jgi:hypothetical protein
LRNSIPKDNGWIRHKNEVSSDMLFKNVIERALQDKIWNEDKLKEKEKEEGKKDE